METEPAARAWPGTIRLASDADGPAIGRLFQACLVQDQGVDWTQPGIGNWWILAETPDGALRGAVQIVASKPFGYIGEILVHPAERGRNRNGDGSMGRNLGALAATLFYASLHLLREAGVEIVRGTVAEENAALRGVLRRHGATDVGRFHLLATRLREGAWERRG